jgi:MFS family permease
MPVVQTVISDVVLTARARPVPGLFQRRLGRGRIGGPVLGGVFAEHLHWSMIFWINVPLAFGALGDAACRRWPRFPVFHRNARSTGSAVSC